jgi:hypothetical protein
MQQPATTAQALWEAACHLASACSWSFAATAAAMLDHAYYLLKRLQKPWFPFPPVLLLSSQPQDQKKNFPKLCENLSPQQIIITLLLSNQLSIFLPVLDSKSFLLLLRLPFSCSNQTRWWSHQFCRKQKLHFFLFVTVSPQHHRRRRHHQHDHDHD